MSALFVLPSSYAKISDDGLYRYTLGRRWAPIDGPGSAVFVMLNPSTADANDDYLLTPYYGSAESSKPVDQPIGTLTTRDRYALIMRNNNGGAEMSTPAREVLRTLTTAGHQSLLTPGDLEAAEAQVDDCLFRMLEPTEVAAGMAFPADYLWDGNRRERVKLAGNAVTPPAARDLGSCIAEALVGAA